MSAGVARWARAVTAALVLALVAGCTTSRPTPASTAVSVHVSPGSAASVRTADGFTVSLPAHTVSGPGVLAVEPAARGVLHGWTVHLSGASLTGAATLTFPGSPVAAEPAPLVQYASTPDGDLTAVDDVHVTGSSASVSTTHFSSWFVTWWSSMTAKVQAAWEQVMAPAAVGVAPSCTGTDQLKASGVSVTASADDRVAWCAGVSPAGKPRVSIVNARGYPMTVLATSHMVLTNPDNSWQTLFSRLMSTLGNGLVPAGMSRVLLPAGGGFTFDDTGSDTQGLKVTEDFAAYQATSLLYAVDTVLTMGDLSGRSTTLEEVVGAIADTAECFSSSRDAAATQPANTDQVIAFMDAAIGVVSGCLGEVLKRVYQDKAASSMLSGAVWLYSGVKQLIAGASAIKDLVALAGSPFTIVLTPAASTTAGSAPCSEQALRAARVSGGDDPLLAPDDAGTGTWYDTFVVHACTGSWALVESSHSSGSALSFWLMQAHGSAWSIVASTGVRLDTPLTQPLFTRADLQAAGLDPVVVSTGLGTNTTKTGRPIIESGSAPAGSSDQLASLTAPAMCNRPATKLVNGAIPGLSDQDGFTSIADGPGDTRFSLTGPAGPGGVPLTAVVFDCSAGGVHWPQVIGLYDSSLTLRGSITLGDLDGQEHSNVSALSIRSGVLHVDWFTNDSCHTGASVTVPRHGDFPVDDSWRATPGNLVTDPDPSPCGG